MAMSQLVVLKLAKGNWHEGFPTVTVQLWEEGAAPLQWTASLPAAHELSELYGRWRSLYVALYCRINWRQSASKIEIEADDGLTHVSEAAFQQLCQQLKTQLERWLEFSSFSKVERQLRTRLLPQDEIRVIVETEDSQLRQFPWHLWGFFDDYPQAEVALSTPDYGRVEVTPRSATGRVRILAILGNSEGIDVQQDRLLFEQLPTAETVFLVEPQRSELDRWLWDEQGWDILFFAGHSDSQADGAEGEIAINRTERLTIAQLKNALRAAIARGLKLALFNSCDGLGLARAMADLHIPQLIVMRQPVPDQVAQAFLKHWLTAFAGGKSCYRAVREAREKLQGLENQFPCASWLPVICQNPAEVPLSWQRLRETPAADLPQPQPARRWAFPNGRGLQTGVVVGAIATGMLIGIRCLGWLQPLELSAYDHLMRLRPSQDSADARILVVEVTQADTQRYGYPQSDATLAAAIEKLIPMQPRAIGLDMHRYQARPPGRSAFLAQFQQHPNLFLVCFSGATDRDLLAPPPEFSADQQINQVGFSDLPMDGSAAPSSDRSDVVGQGQSTPAEHSVRRQFLSYDPHQSNAASACLTPYSFSWQLTYQFLTAAQVQPLQVNPATQNWQFGNVEFAQLPTRFVGYSNLRGNQVMINYRTAQPGAHVTLTQLLEGAVNRSLVENRVVLIGVTAPIANDSFATPYGEMPGLWIHAHMVSQMLSAVLDQRPLIWGLPQYQAVQWGDALWILLWSALGGVLAWRCRSPLWLGGTTVAAMLVLHQLCLILLIQGGWMPLVPALLGLSATSGVSGVLKFVRKGR
ncbi:MAG TPA: CHASE2 domain-containing protein, partial [Coleofasciculaceae cyanobacterium]